MRRLIEEAFPLRAVSDASRHEKSVRHGHISTLHIWPARRPLAASRAAVLAALLPDPGTREGRQRQIDRIAAISRWGTEGSAEVAAFAKEVRAAYGRPPRVLDPFAGGGAIPFEAMRLGCEVVANDYNPVAWFILKCALEYPQRLAGKTLPLPAFALDGETAAAGAARSHRQAQLDAGKRRLDGDLERHVRAWGAWVLARARAELGRYYPDVDGHPVVAYLWARTVPCQDPACGLEIPLLRTRWLCKKKGQEKRSPKLRALELDVDREQGRVTFRVVTPGSEREVPARGTMARNGVTCPGCGAFMRLAYVQAQARDGRFGQTLTAVVIDTDQGKEYRCVTPVDVEAASVAKSALPEAAKRIPFGLPDEPINAPDTRAIFVQLYGLTHWRDLFTPRQLLALATFVRLVREAGAEMEKLGYPEAWAEAVAAYLAAVVDRLADRGSTICHFDIGRETIANTFAAFRLGMSWDFAEANPVGDTSGSFDGAIDWVAKFAGHALAAEAGSPLGQVTTGTAERLHEVASASVDLVVTDPPYYDAIPYADLSDFFYVWLRRCLGDQTGTPFASRAVPKDEELVQKAGKGVTKAAAKQVYEDGMARAFGECHRVLTPNGTMVVVFAHKDPAAWETLLGAMIRAGFAVTASWPIDTELANRTRAQVSAALASSLWLVCEKRDANSPVGRYAEVRRTMQERLTERLRYFWDQGLGGADLVWAAVGPALESYSRHPEVRRVDGSPYPVAQFLREVRRLVTDFALGNILHGTSTETVDERTRYYLMHRYAFGLAPAPAGECILLSQAYGIDLADLRSPRGLLATASRPRPAEGADPDDDGENDGATDDDGAASDAPTLARASGSELRLVTFAERTRPDLGESQPGMPTPYVDSLHLLMRHWADGRSADARAYLDRMALSENEPFWAVAQSVLEMAEAKSRERSVIEALVAWGRPRLVAAVDAPPSAVQIRIDTASQASGEVTPR